MKHTNLYKEVPEGLKPYMAMEAYFKTVDIDPLLIELIKIRTSQINGCAYCTNMHTIDAMKMGKQPKEFSLSMLGVKRTNSQTKKKQS